MNNRGPKRRGRDAGGLRSRGWRPVRFITRSRAALGVVPGGLDAHLERDRYSLVSVLIVIVSPSATKCGTWITIPVSSVAGFRVLVTAAFLMPGSVCMTLRLTVLGRVTLRGVVS